MALLETLPPVARDSSVYSTLAMIEISSEAGTGAGKEFAIAAKIELMNSCGGLAWLQGH